MDSTRIDLPPRNQHSARRKTSPVAFILVAVMSGAFCFWLGFQKARTMRKPAANTVQAAALNTGAGTGALEGLTKAREALESGDWLVARNLYEDILEKDPVNSEARATLPLITRHLDEARGGLVIHTEPEGATVRLEGQEEQLSPAQYHDLPLGRHAYAVSLPGFETYEGEVEVVEGEIKETDPIELAKSVGSLRVSSQPEGAKFKLFAVGAANGNPVVEGITSTMLEDIPAGAYRVEMQYDGWPAVEHPVDLAYNREASVSHVFSRGGLNVTSDPTGASVWLSRSEDEPLRRVGATPLNLSDLSPGQVTLELRYRNWPPIHRTVDVTGGKEQQLDFEWKRVLVAMDSDPPGAEVYRGIERLGEPDEVTPLEIEMPEGAYTLEARHPLLEPATREYSVRSGAINELEFSFDYGSVSIGSEPAGADVIMDGRVVGRTPLEWPVVKPGNYQFSVVKNRHRSAVVSGRVNDGQTLEFNARLKFDPTPRLEESFDNSVGQTLSWVAPLKGWAGAHEVTQQAFEAVMGENPSAYPGPKQPVETVSWYQAQQFCEKLTIAERSLGMLPPGYSYQLPTDAEWSVLAENASLDAAITSRSGRPDGPAPVGTRAPNQYGLYDVRGNVWEWCEDWYNQEILKRVQDARSSGNPAWLGTERKVLRGGAWNRSENDLDLNYRLAARPSGSESYDIGFRVMLLPGE